MTRKPSILSVLYKLRAACDETMQREIIDGNPNACELVLEIRDCIDEEIVANRAETPTN